MNLTWQIIKNDLLHLRWALTVLLGCFVYLFFLHNRGEPGRVSNFGDFYMLTALLLIALLSFLVLTRFIHSDHPVDSTAFWRTRPIAPGRLVMAKLFSMVMLFIGLPLLLVFFKAQFSANPPVGSAGEYGLIGLVIASNILSVAAVAACTRNILQCLLLWVGLYFGTVSLMELLSRLAPEHTNAVGIPPGTVWLIMGFSVIISLAIILNQYLRRSMVTSIVLLATGSVGTAMLGGLWTYYYFYQA